MVDMNPKSIAKAALVTVVVVMLIEFADSRGYPNPKSLVRPRAAA